MFRHNFTDAHEPHQSLYLNDVHTNVGEKQVKTPDFINNIFLKPDFEGKVEEIQANGSEWRYLRI